MYIKSEVFVSMSLSSLTAKSLSGNLDLPSANVLKASSSRSKAGGAPTDINMMSEEFADFAVNNAHAVEMDTGAPMQSFGDALSPEALSLNASSGSVTMTINLGFESPQCGNGACTMPAVTWNFADAIKVRK